MRARVTLSRLFLLCLVGVVLLLALYFSLLLAGSRHAIIRSSETLRVGAAQRAAGVVDAYLQKAATTINDVASQIDAGACDASSPRALEPCLFGQLLENPELAEVALTRGPADGDGARWQLAVRRSRPGVLSPICIQTTRAAGSAVESSIECRPASARLSDPPATRTIAAASDPTLHPTFSTPASPRFLGDTLWSDLSFYALDAQLPEAARRVVVNVLRGIRAPDSPRVRVIRVALSWRELDEEVRRLRVNEDDPADPYRIFLSDESGRLVTRTSSSDRLSEVGEELRVQPARLAPEIARALQQPALAQVDNEHPFASSTFLLDGRRFFARFRALPHTQGWRVGIVGPEDYYLGGLRRARAWMVVGSLGILGILMVGGGLALRSIRRGLARITRETARMRRFEFNPAQASSSFEDVNRTLDSIERAKTALRALGKYAPIELVRDLYEHNREPALGGELRELSLMFTDIRDFTALAERQPPDRLAQLLGRYFEVMTTAIRGTGGTIDKYIGDAVMAMWNAPHPIADHAVRACRAALACVDATKQLFSSPAWSGLEPLMTRFGIHRGEVMVGHYGAPDRLSYTALGDGVNLASRLEGLNKEYGTSILVSAAIYESAKHELEFRRLDRVAVKGKSQVVEVYELLGKRGESGSRSATARVYERALDAYFRREFALAISLLDEQPDDPPGRVLRARSVALLAAPPPGDWNGTFFPSRK